jgi:ABC-type transport system substrate-binding protein
MRTQSARFLVPLVVCVALVFSLGPAGRAAPAKDNLIVASYGEPTTLDVRFHTGRIGFVTMYPMYETLFRHDIKGEVTGLLAESWKWDDPQSLRVRLRRGVTFHDGQPFTARDVKYSLESIANPTLRSRQQTYLNEIASVDIVNDYEVVIRTSRQSRAILRFLTYYGQIVPARAKTPNAEGIDLARTPVGTGPFRFVEYVPGNRLVYERYDKYWGQAPAFRSLVFRIILEPGTRAAALEARDVDIALGVPAESRAILRQKGFKVDVTQTVAIYALTVETTTRPFSALLARQAAAYAIDKQAIAKLHAPESEVAKSILGPGVWARYEQPPFPYDPERAKRLLKEAGAEGTEISYIYDPANTDGSTVIPEAVGEYLRRAGFKVRMQAMERGTFNANVYTQNRKVNMWTWTWGVGTLDPEEIFRREFHSTRGAIWVSRKNLLLDQLIDQALGEIDEAKATAMYKKVQQIILQDAGWIPLYNIVDAVGYRSDLKGLVQLTGGGLFLFDHVSF